MKRQILDTLGELSFVSRGRLQEMARREGMTLQPFQQRVLSFVGRFPDQKQQQLMQQFGRDKGQVARAFKALEQQGLIRRCGRSTPKRIVQAEMTPEGEAYFQRLEQVRLTLAEAALEGFSEQEAHQLEAFLRRIIHNVGRTEETPSGQEPRE
ncbi:MarR family transcriptional regulator [Salinicola sp. LHM]|jgi:DNA-binding MarR family transcriptional regulator|uniref:MarR family winged helix-turn-helix transcriptional regulator n=1 Tax=Salinicola TaxID=404432 RepID=UPI0008DE3190|nr:MULTISPECIES: MarR family transcriptional regulator [Salinicola]MDF3918015.1 MarR family transcriptional regulator [Salinicola salarius]MEC8918360.1 MarR family transcriptional regulator [Pseudomonadota bacterium]OHZ02942.1 hypothetical protein BC443_14695 [Salinicola sp. MIT1003]WQH32876.1 MarR family transcriptional regulator [Salinicola sp. LHM]